MDTTYAHPNHQFPSQKIILDYTANYVNEFVHCFPKTLILVASYTIGKEKVFSSIYKKLGLKKIHVDSKKLRILSLLDLDFESALTINPLESSLHVISWGKLGRIVPGGYKFLPDFDFSYSYLTKHNSKLPKQNHYTHLLAIIPTGWSEEFKKESDSHLHSEQSKGSCTFMQIPYSEHSNFNELCDFVEALKPVRVIPTVISNKSNEQKIMNYFSRFVDRQSAEKNAFQKLFANSFKSQEKSVINSQENSIKLQEKVKCPKCHALLFYSKLNSHLDDCLS